MRRRFAPFPRLECRTAGDKLRTGDRVGHTSLVLEGYVNHGGAMKGRCKGVLPLVAAALCFGSAEAQVAWDAPFLVQPSAPSGWTFVIFEPDPGDEVGLFLSWRGEAVPAGLRFRLGLAEGADGDVAALGGVNVSGDLFGRELDSPVDLVWFAGAGGSVSDDVLLSFPAGLSVGWSFAHQAFTLQPWLAPRVVLDGRLGAEGRGDTEVDLEGVVEVGLDLVLAGGWVARFGASFVGRDALGVGLTLPLG